LRRQDGFTLVAIVIAIAILTIMMAAVAPAIYVIMQRDRENELIFRGKQYARGIALFQRRYGRLPTTLKEMYENHPRTLRKLWKEPMCGCDDWYLIIQGTPDANPVAFAPPGQPTPSQGSALPQLTPTPSPFGSPGATKNVGPIIGVRSKVKKQSLQDWRGLRSYDQWKFISGDADLDMIGGIAQPGVPGPVMPTQPPGH
jgi:type II secretory pathway pseudopilin PulG